MMRNPLPNLFPALITLTIAVVGLFVVTPLVKAAPDEPRPAVTELQAPPTTSVAEPAPPAVPDPTKDDLDEHHRRIADNTLAVMNDSRWSHLAGIPTADYEQAAHDIASAVDLGNDATLLATLGYMETGFAAFVDDGRCNDPAWRASPEGRSIMGGKSCDGGQAYSIFQIHPIIDKTSPLYSSCSKQAISVRAGAAGCALKIARASMEATSSLQNYTGEWGVEHPKADKRLEMANRAIARHPLEDSD